MPLVVGQRGRTKKAKAKSKGKPKNTSKGSEGAEASRPSALKKPASAMKSKKQRVTFKGDSDTSGGSSKDNYGEPLYDKHTEGEHEDDKAVAEEDIIICSEGEAEDNEAVAALMRKPAGLKRICAAQQTPAASANVAAASANVATPPQILQRPAASSENENKEDEDSDAESGSAEKEATESEGIDSDVEKDFCEMSPGLDDQIEDFGAD